jgi:flagellar biosynthetic protein FliP
VKRLALLALPAFLALFWVDPAWAQEGVLRLPTITMGVEEAVNPEQVSTALQIVVLLTILTLAPGILIMTTSFTRLAVVFSLLRNAMGTQQMPPAQIIVGLSLFLTFFIMAPVFNQIHDTALEPYIDGQLGQEEFLKKAASPLRSFMLKQTRQKDLGLFMKIAGEDKPQNADDVPLTSLIPAFVVSELKTAFQIGFLLYVPFLVIDMVVASVLLSMGMMMLPPVMVSLPFKLMLFVLVDGWFLIVGSLVRSFA